MTYRGHIKNGVAVLDDSVSLPDGTPVIIQTGQAFGFWENLTVQEMADRQQVQATSRPADLAGDWPAEDHLDEFLSTVREGRR